MKTVRLALAAALGASVLLPVVGGLANASAAAKPACNLVTDKAGDTSVYPAGGLTSDALDITSVDLATNKRSLTAVIRVKKLAATSAAAPSGQQWQVGFNAGGVDFGVSAHANAAGSVLYYAFYSDPTTNSGSIYSATVTGVFDMAKSEIRMTTPLTTFAGEASIASGKTKITGISGQTGAEILIPEPSGRFGNTLFSYAPFEADLADGGKDYLAGSASCVAVGK